MCQMSDSQVQQTIPLTITWIQLRRCMNKINDQIEKYIRYSKMYIVTEEILPHSTLFLQGQQQAQNCCCSV